ncbi:hypothetical protein A3G67_02515 [Candidatus Roizmanbacteria bacterium RIFCSPLOWO2_12_FULL_40_12]|uniref:Uncharacterized protein n=1 Tax=Candidatus Roizmanbacteria bacterium RIFCSPLOWO2_01_FULL_40_42 TaxID=1802066 RepID=A0A1F7J642_9BACT|nr:MAG: hypothetical protein A3C31_03770 [Candidatus Roizmanbacteria bacterium RIFCSPHIGHO2_02_FULL_40_53]OGK29407.1 MAG: hypothetical protein A2W49_04135 [Candidatus Roizmanbacteria bacterium RIFCSPHIGHO2_12_41_18]OGK36610.1 MAG: hypothetical protein A3E69_00040 [Candidatus Roizmanbacteria bacterium RIFCSPHIGHO2_12_FULL_40_130]OGK51048.1 MAG: hypothetical protein A3B50_02690 [Candidatus Roizmanbacteria bacterium RIFCSPLOWO2_01_FULL_40_42]OGK59121.1 MAG: hypothetical protein A3H84_01370 [Candid
MHLFKRLDKPKVMARPEHEIFRLRGVAPPPISSRIRDERLDEAHEVGEVATGMEQRIAQLLDENASDSILIQARGTVFKAPRARRRRRQ